MRFCSLLSSLPREADEALRREVEVLRAEVHEFTSTQPAVERETEGEPFGVSSRGWHHTARQVSSSMALGARLWTTGGTRSSAGLVAMWPRSTR